MEKLQLTSTSEDASLTQSQLQELQERQAAPEPWDPSVQAPRTGAGGPSAPISRTKRSHHQEHIRQATSFLPTACGFRPEAWGVAPGKSPPEGAGGEEGGQHVCQAVPVSEHLSEYAGAGPLGRPPLP